MAFTEHRNWDEPLRYAGDDTDVLRFAWKEGNVLYHSFLSNFYVEKTGSTLEHDYQAAKTDNLRQKVDILTATSAQRAKSLGRKCDLRPSWETEKISVMRDLVVRKFLGDAKISEWLVMTGQAQLVEGNYWHDNIWGDCYCKKCEDNPGANHLGLILMEVRDLIVSYGHLPHLEECFG